MRGTAKFVCFECRTFRRGVRSGIKLRCSKCQSELIKVPNSTKIPSPKDIKKWKSLQESIIHVISKKYNPSESDIKDRYKRMQFEKKFNKKQ